MIRIPVIFLKQEPFVIIFAINVFEEHLALEGFYLLAVFSVFDFSDQKFTVLV